MNINKLNYISIIKYNSNVSAARVVDLGFNYQNIKVSSWYHGIRAITVIDLITLTAVNYGFTLRSA